jgi:hypothetical protein
MNGDITESFLPSPARNGGAMSRFLDKHESVAIKLLFLAVIIFDGLAVLSLVR